ncbi:MAG TPA: hypothetical protein VK988_05670 [Acidimicrobiales bacterium]|nr:hypothetical protein [Acidimicrobiales bacterium]
MEAQVRRRVLRLASLLVIGALTVTVFAVDIAWLYLALIGAWIVFIIVFAKSFQGRIRARIDPTGQTVTLRGIDPELATALKPSN